MYYLFALYIEQILFSILLTNFSKNSNLIAFHSFCRVLSIISLIF
jgi:hypothetical protein